jgi:hypothetical protein
MVFISSFALHHVSLACRLFHLIAPFLGFPVLGFDLIMCEICASGRPAFSNKGLPPHGPAPATLFPSPAKFIQSEHGGTADFDTGRQIVVT